MVFTCPHCGGQATFKRNDLERVDLGNGCPPSYFLPLAEGQERHIDDRLACVKCRPDQHTLKTLIGDAKE